MYNVHVHVITNEIGWVLLASATSGFGSFSIRLAYSDLFFFSELLYSLNVSSIFDLHIYVSSIQAIGL